MQFKDSLTGACFPMNEDVLRQIPNVGSCGKKQINKERLDVIVRDTKICCSKKNYSAMSTLPRRGTLNPKKKERTYQKPLQGETLKGHCPISIQLRGEENAGMEMAHR